MNLQNVYKKKPLFIKKIILLFITTTTTTIIMYFVYIGLLNMYIFHESEKKKFFINVVLPVQYNYSNKSTKNEY